MWGEGEADLLAAAEGGKVDVGDLCDGERGWSSPSVDVDRLVGRKSLPCKHHFLERENVCVTVHVGSVVHCAGGIDVVCEI